MRKFLKHHVLNFTIDSLLCSLASLAAILSVRLYVDYIPHYTCHVLYWFFCGIAASVIAVYLSKVYKVVFENASFKSIHYIAFCIIVKTALLSIGLLANKYITIPSELTLLISDFTISFIALVMIKSLALSYTEAVTAESQEKRSVECLNILIYGTGKKSTAAALRYKDSHKYNVKGFITRDPLMAGSIVMELPVYYINNKRNESKFKDIEGVLFPTKEDVELETDKLIKHCNENNICVLIIPSTSKTNYAGLEIKEIKHMMENNFIPDRMTNIERDFKRFSDLLVSTLCIIVFAPLMGIIALIIRANDGEPVIYKQERIGRFGRPFYILKFRTMRIDAEEDGPELCSGEDDPRLTKVGHFLKAHHLDELPQLFNIFKGDMSLVGYRPERKYYIDQIVEKDPRYSYLFQIRPGVTSYATLRNGYADTLDKMLTRLQFDLYYLNHRNVFMEMKILWDTFVGIAIGKKF